MKLRKDGTFTEEDAEAFLNALLGDDPQSAQKAKQNHATVKSLAAKKASVPQETREQSARRGNLELLLSGYQSQIRLSGYCYVKNP